MPSSRHPGGRGASAGLCGVGVVAFAVGCCAATPLVVGAVVALGVGAGAGIGFGIVLAAVTIALWLRRRRRARCTPADARALHSPALGQPFGTSRTAGLSDGDRALYRWIVSRFASGDPPDNETLDEHAQRLGVESGPALRRLEDRDLIRRQDGDVTVAYPFSRSETPHEVSLDGRHANAMCAVDALGIPYMLGEQAKIASRDPVSGQAIRVSVGEDGKLAWSPRSAVAVIGTTEDGGPLASVCCPSTNLFASAQTAHNYLGTHPSVSATVVSISEAAASGRRHFGELLTTS